MPPVTRKAPRASKFASRARIRSPLSRTKAPAKAIALKGTFTNSTQRQPGPSVSRPPKRTPAAPPIPETAAQTPRAVLRSRAARNVLVSVDSAAGESMAAHEALGESRADQQRFGVGQAADQRGSGEHDQAGDEHAAAPEQIGHPAAEEQEAAVGEDVAVDHPLQALLAEAKVTFDRRQGDVEDRGVEHVHELDEAQQKQDRDAASRR